MENSYTPSTRKQVSDDKSITTEQECMEESGWTTYFQDFCNNNNNNNDHDDNKSEETSSYSICTISSSLVSDAASYAAWRNNIPQSQNNDFMIKTPKKLSFIKKTRANRVISEDDSLEDTASSPVNSPKVGDLIRMKVQSHDIIDDSMGKTGLSEYYSEQRPKETSIVDFNGKNSEFTDLKQKGLCLVPLSMLVNFDA